jgi:hypothetical protein
MQTPHRTCKRRSELPNESGRAELRYECEQDKREYKKCGKQTLVSTPDFSSAIQHGYW